MKHLKGLIIGIILTAVFIKADGQGNNWIQVASGVWKTMAGTPDKLDLFNASGISPQKEALLKLGDVPFPLQTGKISIQIVDGQTYLRFPLEREEEIFGFGLNFKTIFQRGRIMQLHVDHYGGRDNGRTHAPVPFYVSDRGYGVFINSSRYITVYAGTGVRRDSPEAPQEKDRNTDRDWDPQPYSDAVECLVPAGGIEVYIFGGPTILDAVKRFILYSGGGPLPPRWGLGFTQRVPTLYTSGEVINEASEFQKRGFPLDFIGLEPGWQSRSYPCTLEWDSARYPDPPSFIASMKEMGIRLNLWTNPYISSRSELYEAMIPFTGSHTVWGGVVPDFTIPEAGELFSNHIYKNQISAGISGYKIDECDGYDNWLWPDVAVFPSGNSAEQIRQTYGLLLQRITSDLYHRMNTRTWGLVRASNGGGSSFPFVIYNDYYSHEDFITALINSGYAGVLWTPEVRSSKTGEEWLRRFQTVCFSPMAMINAWASGTKPWSFPDVEADIRRYALLRMELMPYLYSEFARYHYEGTPPFRGMNLEPGFDFETKRKIKDSRQQDDPYTVAVSKEIKDQYMTGENLLVAPMFTGQNSRKVILPPGKWYDFYTGEFAGEAEVITVSPGLSVIPVYVRNGSIIPMMKPALNAPEAGEKYDLEIRHYGTDEGRYMLYDDDGETYDYEKGIYSWREIKVSRNKKGYLEGHIAKAEKGKPDNIGKVTWKFMTAGKAESNK
jgi:alpha-D-xyloside xylohydrolase